MTAKEARAYAQKAAKQAAEQDKSIIETISALILDAIDKDPSIDYVRVNQLSKRVQAALRSMPYDYLVFDVPNDINMWDTVVSWDDSGTITQRFQRR